MDMTVVFTDSVSGSKRGCLSAVHAAALSQGCSKQKICNSLWHTVEGTQCSRSRLP